MRRTRRPRIIGGAVRSGGELTYLHGLPKRLVVFRESRFFFTIGSNVRPGAPNSETAKLLLSAIKDHVAATTVGAQQLVDVGLRQVAQWPYQIEPGTLTWRYDGQQLGHPDEMGVRRPAARHRLEIGDDPRGGRWHFHFSIIIRQRGGRVFFDIPATRNYFRSFIRSIQNDLWGIFPGNPLYIPPEQFYVNIQGSRTTRDVEEYTPEDADQPRGSSVQFGPPLSLARR